jgi:DNA modification methylase
LAAAVRLEVVDAPVAGLRFWGRNPRRISLERLRSLQNALREEPEMLRARPLIALPDGTVVAGNQRLLAARELGWESVPTVFVDLDEARAVEWALRDNRSYGADDAEQLGLLLAELAGAGRDLELTGFDPAELDRLLAPHPFVGDPDVVPTPDLVRPPDSVPGVVYELGPHRLMCGDATNPEHVNELLGGEVPVLLVTDPPYGVELDMEWRDRAGRNKLGHAEPSYLRRNSSIRGDTRADWSEAFALVPSLSVAYVWHADRFTIEVGEGLRSVGFELSQLIVWDKGRFVLSRSHYHSEHELAWYARKTGSPRWRGSRDQSTVWRHASPKMLMTGSGGPGDGRADHPTQKPVALYERPLLNHLVRGGWFYEPFAGSGTALIAAELTGRRCLAMEVDPVYCDVIRQRYEQFANKAA